MLTLGQKIKAARKDLGFTQAELVGDRITRNQLSLIENGINNPSIPTLEFLAERLGKPVSFFLSDDDFLKHQCISLISKCEHLINREDFQSVINSLESFLQNTNPAEFTYNDLLGKIYALLGESYYKVGNPKAEECLQKSIGYLDPKEHYIYVCKTYYNIGRIAFSKGEYEKSEEFLLKSNDILTNITLDNIVLKLSVTYELAYVLAQLNKNEELIPFVKEILEYSQKYKIYHNFGQFNMILSSAYGRNGHYRDAINTSLKAIEFFMFTDDDTLKHQCYTNLGIFYRLTREYNNSLRYLEQSINYFKQKENYKPLMNAKAEKVKTMFYLSNDTGLITEMVSEIFNSVDEKVQNKADLLTILGILALENDEKDDALNLFLKAEEIFVNQPDSEFYAFTNLGLSKLFKYNGDWEKAYQYLSKVNESKFEIKRRIRFES